MTKQTVILNQSKEESTLTIGDVKLQTNNTTLKQFRQQLTKAGFTEINTVYRAGKHVITFISGISNELQLADSGLIKGSKKVREELKKLNVNRKLKQNVLGYSF